LLKSKSLRKQTGIFLASLGYSNSVLYTHKYTNQIVFDLIFCIVFDFLRFSRCRYVVLVYPPVMVELVVVAVGRSRRLRYRRLRSRRLRSRRLRSRRLRSRRLVCPAVRFFIIVHFKFIE
jgi:hypothetical protein